MSDLSGLCQKHLRGTNCRPGDDSSPLRRHFAATSPASARPLSFTSRGCCGCGCCFAFNATMANVPMKGRNLIAVIGDEVRSRFQ